MERKETMVVVPVFYGVNPDEVRNQSGKFGEGFGRLMEKLKEDERCKVMRWRTAMREAAELSGWDSKNITPKSTLIQQIVKDISKRLPHPRSDDFKGLFGIRSRIEQVERLLEIQSSETRVVGIWGMGGIGKTTLADCVFARNSYYFQGSSCFLFNVREKSKGSGGLQQLQRDLLSEVFDKRNPNLNHLPYRKVFIVLDDLDKYNQFEGSIGGRDCVGEGSKIIVTRRDRGLLYNIADDGCVFDVPTQMDRDALQLFCYFAFRRICPVDDFEELSDKVVSYAKGNPLVLKVLGLFLHNNNRKQVWEDTLKKLKRTMNKEIEETLKISYEGLDREQQEIFLHISCFLNGISESFVEEVLGACGFYTSGDLSVLIDRGLIERRNGYIGLHDLLQDMGRQIVREKCDGDPGQMSRLWDNDDIKRVFSEKIGTSAARGIFLDHFAISGLSLSPAVFSSMNGIELLRVYGYVDRYEWTTHGSWKSQFEGIHSLPSSLSI